MRNYEDNIVSQREKIERFMKMLDEAVFNLQCISYYPSEEQRHLDEITADTDVVEEKSDQWLFGDYYMSFFMPVTKAQALEEMKRVYGDDFKQAMTA